MLTNEVDVLEALGMLDVGAPLPELVVAMRPWPLAWRGAMARGWWCPMRVLGGWFNDSSRVLPRGTARRGSRRRHHMPCDRSFWTHCVSL